MTSLSEILVGLPLLASVLLKITIVLGVSWSLHFILAKRNPRWRILLWRCTIVGLLLIPALIPLAYLQISIIPPPEHVVIAPSESALEYPIIETPGFSEAEPIQISQPVASDISQASFSLAAWLRANIWMIVSVGWGLVATILILRLLVGFLRVRHKIIYSLRGPEHLQQLLGRVTEDLGCTKKVMLRYSPDMSTPFLTGLLNPIIIIPERMISGKYENRIPAIFAHEVAHLISRDLIWTFIIRWFEVVLWFHPLVWKLRGVHSTLCEEVSDAVAAKYIGNTESYSSTLASLALEIIGRVQVIGAIPMARSSEIVARLRILKQRFYPARLARRWIILSGLVSFIALAVIGGINLVYAESDPGKSRARVLHFPAGRSVGTLQMHPAGTETKIDIFNWFSDDNWETIGQARGDVIIPAHNWVSLSVSSGIKDLSALSQLGPNDLYQLAIPWLSPNGIAPDDTCMPHVAHLTGLKVLNLQGTHITAEGLKFIRNIKSLERLHLPLLTTDEGLMQIAALPSLKGLHCEKASITSAGFAHFERLTSLEKLFICLERNCDSGFVHVSKLPSLKSLIIRGKFTDAGLKYVSELRDLVNLDLSDKDLDITDAGLVHLGKLRSLRKLSLNNSRITDIGMSHLAQIKSLESLELPNQGITDRGLAYVGKLGKLKFLSVGESSKSSISDTGLGHLSKLDLLEELNIAGTGITNTGMLNIGKLAKLKRLRIGAALTDEGLAKLTTLKSLNQLTINSDGDSTKLTISGLNRLNEMSNLTYLEVDGLVQDNSRLNISGLTKLEKLSIRGDIRLSYQDLACFANLTHLKWLQGIDGISDVGAAYLKNLTSMERLTIGGADLTDRGLSYLSYMNNLNHLILRGNFTDKGLRHLEKLKSLKLLKIYSANNFSPTALKRLQDNLPNLRSFTADQDRNIGVKTKQPPTLPKGEANLNLNKSSEHGRVLHFPKNRSLGRIVIQDANINREIQTFYYWEDGANWYEAEYLGEAQGDVVIPGGKRVGLFVNETAGKYLSALTRLKPNDLYFLTLPSSVNNSSMRYVTNLTGLRVLHLAGNINDSGMRNINKLKSLERLTLSERIGNAGLRQISKLPSLKGLYFQQTKITDEGLAMLSRLSTLEELELNGEYIGDAGLVHLAKLPSLSYLILRGKNFSDAGMAHLKNVSSLRILNLLRLPITDAGVRHLSGHAGLENLSLFNTQVTDRGLVYLKSMPSLKKLDIGKSGSSGPHLHQITDVGMAHLAETETLEYLVLPDYDITDKGLAEISKLKNLKYLRFVGYSKNQLTDISLQHISKLQKLEVLSISVTGSTDAGMDDLVKLTNLRELNLPVDSVSNEGLAKLKALKSLERLSLVCKNVTISGLSHLNALENLVYLDVRDIRQDNSGLDISGLNKLENLTLTLGATRNGKETVYDPIRDEDLACLEKLTNLRWFQIGHTEHSMITDAGIAHLRDLSNMTRLAIGSPYLTDKSLWHLTNMKKLNFLSIIGNFTDDGLVYLEQLKGLNSLRIYSANNFSPKALQQLQGNLPNMYPNSFRAEQDRDIKKMTKNKPEPSTNNTVAPSFAVKTLDGKDMKLENYRGKVVLLYFWAMWCRPCVAGTPKLKKFYRDLKSSFGDDFEMISLSMDDNEQSVRRHVKKHKLTWPQVRIGLYSKISSDYGVNDSAPQSFLIGPDGKILLTPESPQVDTKSFIEELLKSRKL